MTDDWLEAVRAQVAALGASRATPEEADATLRGLLTRAPDLPRAFVVRLWREMEGVASGRPCAVWGGGGIADLARRRFGSSVRLTPVPSPREALTFARTGGVAVLALDQTGWWGRLLAEPTLQAFAALPELAIEGAPAALAVAAVRLEPGGHQETLWVTDAAPAADAIEADLAGIGFAARLVTQATGLKLFALAGYVQAHDERLARAPGRLTGVVGAVPQPFDL